MSHSAGGSFPVGHLKVSHDANSGDNFPRDANFRRRVVPDRPLESFPRCQFRGQFLHDANSVSSSIISGPGCLAMPIPRAPWSQLTNRAFENELPRDANSMNSLFLKVL